MRLFTSESVTEGHPDKICDQISDSILDAIIEKDPSARVACEAMVTTGLVFVTGEITTNCYVDIEGIVRSTLREIGYDRAKYGFDCETCAVITSLKSQSPDIAQGVDNAFEARIGAMMDGRHIGAGDQGMMFGYACDETPDYMPMAIFLAHKLTKRLAQLRKDGTLDYLRPDGKAQVTVDYEGDTPLRVDTVVVSAQHSPKIPYPQLQHDILEKVIKHEIPERFLDQFTNYFINPTGRFVIGGPQGDSGLTGRKIIVDTYGGYAAHGGGSFSGKDPTKVDRSAAYAARHAAKNIVAAGLAKKCEIELAYAIGVAYPVSVNVNTYGTGKLPDEMITDIVMEHFDFRPAVIIDTFQLLRPIYKKTAVYGHFGRPEENFPWERLDKLDELKGY